DLAELRQLVPPTVQIVAKIEKATALEDLDRILAACDAVMVARGDLGVELPFEEVPIVQKRLIREANRRGKPVITATQMLESMVNHPPTRADPRGHDGGEHAPPARARLGSGAGRRGPRARL